VAAGTRGKATGALQEVDNTSLPVKDTLDSPGSFRDEPPKTPCLIPNTYIRTPIKSSAPLS
jgi:hypothetical protein